MAETSQGNEALRPRAPRDGAESGDKGGETDAIEEIIGKYLDRLDSGEEIEPEEVLLEHPRVGHDVLKALRDFVDFGVEGIRERNLDATNEGPDGDMTENRPGVSDPAAARTIGDYTLEREIGRGGMAVVYEAWQSSLDRRVALKVLPAGVAADMRSYSRFLREAQIAAKLSHPNVVSVYGFGVEAQTPYFAMELVEGETLAAVLARMRSDPRKVLFGNDSETTAYYSRLAEAFAGAADGLQHAHAKRIVHRDIKPSNVILDREDRLRILDFGLARLEGQESLTLSGDLVGTPRYMSPEQARRQKVMVDHRTDVYSLGATLYEMVCWKPPFEGKDHQDTLSQIVDRDPVEPGKLNPEVPKDLETIVLKCLRKEPPDRYGTAEALAQDLRRFSRGDHIEARPEARWKRFSRSMRRRRASLLALLSASFLLLALGWAVWEREASKLDAVRLRHDAVVLEAAKEIYRHRPQVLGMEVGEDLFRFFPLWSTDRSPGDLEGLSSSLAQAAEAVPERAEAPYYLARALWFAGKGDAARREAARALARSPDLVPAEILLREVARGAPPVDASEIDGLLDRYRATADGESWQEAWLLSYKHTWTRSWPEAAEAFGELLQFRKPEGEPYLGCTVEALMGRGIARLHSRQLEGAVQDFAGAWRIWPWFPEAALFLASAWREAGNGNEAESVLQELYSSRSLIDGDAKNEVAARIAMWHWLLDRKEKAREWIELVEGPYRLRVEAWFHYHEGAFEECVALLESLSEELVGATLRGYARLNLQADRFGAAWDEERRDILAQARSETRLHHELARYLLALALEANGHRNEAFATVRAGLELQARKGVQHFVGAQVLAGLERRSGRLAEAGAVLRPALESEPENRFLRFELALVLEDMERYDEALGEYEALISQKGRHNSYFPALYFGRAAAVLNRMGRHEEAFAKARIAVDNLPRNSPGYEEVAYALWKLGRPMDALVATEAGLAALPGRVRLNLLRGWILESEGKLEEAVGSFIKALALRPEYVEAHEALRKTIKTLGRVPTLPEISRLVGILETAAPSAGERERILTTISLLRSDALENPEAK